jgi:hypothetical protein
MIEIKKGYYINPLAVTKMYKWFDNEKLFNDSPEPTLKWMITIHFTIDQEKTITMNSEKDANRLLTKIKKKYDIAIFGDVN